MNKNEIDAERVSLIDVLDAKMKRYDLGAVKRLLSDFQGDQHGDDKLRKEMFGFNDATALEMNELSWVYAGQCGVHIQRNLRSAKDPLTWAEKPAEPLYEEWRAIRIERLMRKGERIPAPVDRKMSIQRYVERLGKESGSRPPCGFFVKELRSFLDFLRKKIPEWQTLIPLSLEIWKEPPTVEKRFARPACIVQKPRKGAVPLSYAEAAKTVRSLVDKVLMRESSTAAKTLGLTWLCLTVSATGLQVEVSALVSLKLDALKVEVLDAFPFDLLCNIIRIPSSGGVTAVAISPILTDYLRALPRRRDSEQIFDGEVRDFCKELACYGDNLNFQRFLQVPKI